MGPEKGIQVSLQVKATITIHNYSKANLSLSTSYLILGMPGKNSPSQSPESQQSVPIFVAGHIEEPAI